MAFFKILPQVYVEIPYVNYFVLVLFKRALRDFLDFFEVFLGSSVASTDLKDLHYQENLDILFKGYILDQTKLADAVSTVQH